MSPDCDYTNEAPANGLCTRMAATQKDGRCLHCPFPACETDKPHPAHLRTIIGLYGLARLSSDPKVEAVDKREVKRATDARRELREVYGIDGDTTAEDLAEVRYDWYAKPLPSWIAQRTDEHLVETLKRVRLVEAEEKRRRAGNLWLLLDGHRHGGTERPREEHRRWRGIRQALEREIETRSAEHAQALKVLRRGRA